MDRLHAIRRFHLCGFDANVWRRREFSEYSTDAYIFWSSFWLCTCAQIESYTSSIPEDDDDICHVEMSNCEFCEPKTSFDIEIISGYSPVSRILHILPEKITDLHRLRQLPKRLSLEMIAYDLCGNGVRWIKSTRHRHNEFLKNFNSKIFCSIRWVGECHFLPSLVWIVFLPSYQKMFPL